LTGWKDCNVQNSVLPKSLAKPVFIDAQNELKKQTPNLKSLAKKFYPTYIPGYKESVQKVPEIYTNSYLDDKISVVSHIFLN
jgi:hypothetical protein